MEKPEIIIAPKFKIKKKVVIAFQNTCAKISKKMHWQGSVKDENKEEQKIKIKIDKNSDYKSVSFYFWTSIKFKNVMMMN